MRDVRAQPIVSQRFNAGILASLLEEAVNSHPNPTLVVESELTKAILGSKTGAYRRAAQTAKDMQLVPELPDFDERVRGTGIRPLIYALNNLGPGDYDKLFPRISTQ